MQNNHSDRQINSCAHVLNRCDVLLQALLSYKRISECMPTRLQREITSLQRVITSLQRVITSLQMTITSLQALPPLKNSYMYARSWLVSCAMITFTKISECEDCMPTSPVHDNRYLLCIIYCPVCHSKASTVSLKSYLHAQAYNEEDMLRLPNGTSEYVITCS